MFNNKAILPMGKKNIDLQSVFILLVSVFLASCSHRSYYQSEIEIPEAIWHMNKAAGFKAEITDTLMLYNIKLAIESNPEYRYSNLWLFIRSVSPDNFAHMDTIEVYMAETDGKWLGEKNGNSYSVNFDYKKMIKFPKSGIYRFEIIQGMRDPELKGINKIKFELIENN